MRFAEYSEQQGGAASDSWQGPRLDPERLERKVREHLERKAREDLAEVGHVFAGKLSERLGRGGEAAGRVAARDWHDRAASLAEIALENLAWDGLLAGHELAVREAANDMLLAESASQISDYLAAAEGARDSLRREERELRSADRLEAGHLLRIASLAGEDSGRAERAIATKVAWKTAELLAGQIAPGGGAVMAQVAAKVMDACETAARLDAADVINLTVPVTAFGELISLDIGTGLADCDRLESAAGAPRIELVEDLARPAGADPQPPDEQHGWIGKLEQVADEMRKRVCPKAEGEADTGWTPLGAPAAGLVIWGSSAAVAAAARTRRLNGENLLSYARNAAWTKVWDGTPGSVNSAMRVVNGLEVIVLLDPGIRGGLWVDVDPVTKAPAATLLVDMSISAGGLAEFRLLQL